jgi:hypothetical protein
VRARAGHRTQKVSNTAKKDGALAPVRVAGQTVRARPVAVNAHARVHDCLDLRLRRRRVRCLVWGGCVHA